MKADLAGAAIGEVVQRTVGTSWQTLSFANYYVGPVVFALAPTLDEVAAATTRFRNVSGADAEIRLQESETPYDPDTGFFGPNSGAHVDETVTLLVMERRVHTLEDGTIVQVGEISANTLYVKGFEAIDFAKDFARTPLIFFQAQTYNGNDFIISSQRNPDGACLQLAMQEEQADTLNHAHEPIGRMAIRHGSGSLSTMDWRVGSLAQNVNFGATVEDAPLVVASLASYNGANTSSPRIGAVTQTKFTAMALKGQFFDTQANHGGKIIDWMAFSQFGTIYEAAPAIAASAAAPERLVAETGIAEASDVAMTVSFGAQFEHPVVIASLTSRASGVVAIARISNVTGAGFDLMLQTPGGDARAAAAVSSMVVEAGSWQIADGTMLQAGLSDLGLTTCRGVALLDVVAGFTVGPSVLSQTKMTGDDAFVKTWMQGVGADRFVFAAGVLAGMATFNAPDTGAARVDAVTGAGFEVKVEEDMTLNAETGHGVEGIH